MQRFYTKVMEQFLSQHEQMFFLAGPRQVGKTTISKSLPWEATYLTWDEIDHQQIMLEGGSALKTYLHLDTPQKKTVIFDEIHKRNQWKNYLKGIYDQYKEQLHIVVTGSSRLDVYQKGSDSMMGRYFLCRVHPLSIREMEDASLPSTITSNPLPSAHMDLLFQFGGFPSPLVKADPLFSNRWHNLRYQQLLEEDIRDMTHIQEINLLQHLMLFLQTQIGQLLNQDRLSQKLRVSATTIHRWMCTLETFYFCFLIRPYHNNVARSLMKTPKPYLWDWSVVEDPGAKLENFVASHLLKAVHFWTDYGFGIYDLFFLRDKDGAEVDFLITQNGTPWCMIEVKKSYANLSPSLQKFQKQLNVPYVFQAVYDLPFLDIDLFEKPNMSVVPLATLLSQLV